MSEVADLEAWLERSRAQPGRSRLADELRAIVDPGNYEALELAPSWRMFVPKGP